MRMVTPPNFKQCVVVGNGAVGKTYMLSSYFENVQVTKTSEWIPTEDSKRYASTIEGEDVEFWDTPVFGEIFDQRRLQTYPGADVVIICFSIVSPTFLETVITKWQPEVQKYAPNASILLVGTKLDLRDDEEVRKDLRDLGLEPVSYEDGSRAAEKILARYIECSALTRQNLDSVFREAVKLSK
ncbi:related to Rho GTPase Rac [Ramularia collo-cygni]|uniref:Related to Rho GTPase Rac n=1 Tax=Ramularia collo-cygni TaxID=112498 RepID=A0A2D3V1M3_9PEZI|nr:related to Rho GTPase Rac [Ramularia collo-cygni]CZT15399.1 related to Rho GTPase Rac [Ramularia collo-cygni]